MSTPASTPAPEPSKPDNIVGFEKPDEPLKCEGCGRPAVTSDPDGVPLCQECLESCPTVEERIEELEDENLKLRGELEAANQHVKVIESTRDNTIAKLRAELEAAKVKKSHPLSFAKASSIADLMGEALKGVTQERNAARDELAAVKQEASTLDVQLKQRVADFLNERMCCNGQDCGCMGITRLQQLVAEEAHEQIQAANARAERYRAALEVAQDATARLDCPEDSRIGRALTEVQAALAAEQTQEGKR